MMTQIYSSSAPLVLKYCMIVYALHKQRAFCSEPAFLDALKPLLPLHDSVQNVENCKYSQLCDDFLSFARKLCALEAQSFFTQEDRSRKKGFQRKLLQLRAQLRHLGRSDHFWEGAGDMTPRDWRILMSLVSTFESWCQSTQYFQQKLDIKEKLLQEAPFLSLCHLSTRRSSAS
jgi:hypothetical protein